MSEQPKALDMAHRLATRKVTNWVHATGDTPRSSGFCSDQECIEAAALLRTQHAELEDLRKEVERLTEARKQAQIDRAEALEQAARSGIKARRDVAEQMRELRDALHALYIAAPVTLECHHFHHSKAEQHSALERCKPKQDYFDALEMARKKIDAARGAKG